MTQTVTVKPAKLNIALYGDGNPWAVNMAPTVDRVPLGDMTTATIVAAYRPDGAVESILLTVAVLSPTTFAVGHTVPVAGRYDVQIALAGGLARTYIHGTITVQAESA